MIGSLRLPRVPAGPADPAVRIAAAVAVAGCTAYALTRPWAPDLAAQVARASAAGHGVRIWWESWYGGTAVPSYSVLCGPLMHAIGVRGTGILATAAVAVLSGMLARSSTRPRLTAAVAASAATVNLVSGRITFAVGLALALAAVVLFTRGRPTLALLPAVVAGLASPLASLVPILVGGAYVLVSAGRARWHGLLLASAAAAPIGVLSLLYSGPSVMPFDLTGLSFGLLACGGVAALTTSRTVRAVALLSGALAVAAYLIPSPLGSNAIRLPLLAGVPLVVATGRRPRSTTFVIAVLAGLTWAGTNLIGDLVAATGPSTGAAFYQPILDRFPAGLTDHRIEVVDPSSHGADLYLGTRLPLARGWERQVDYAENPLFYDGTLSPASYRTWLDRMAVKWVALPAVPLDYGSRGESRLIQGGLPYLRRVWQGAGWTLYRVSDPAPLAVGAAAVAALTPSKIVLRSGRAGEVLVRARYSPRLQLRDARGDVVPGSVLVSQDGGAAFRVDIPGPGTWSLGS